jgi:hypothetical protein
MVGLCRHFDSDRAIFVTNINVNIHHGLFRYSAISVISTYYELKYNF